MTMQTLTLEQAKKLRQHDFVVDLEEAKILHFGYVSGTGHCVCYKPGEQNMQDAYAIKPEGLMLLRQTKHHLRSLADR